MSKYFIGVLAIVALLVTAGCSVVVNNSVNNNDGSKDNATGTLRAGGGNRNPQAELFKNLPKGTVADLVVGKNVQITGTTNSDGTVNAARIMIGAMPDFERRGITSSTQPTATGTPGQGRMRGGNGQGYGGFYRDLYFSTADQHSRQCADRDSTDSVRLVKYTYKKTKMSLLFCIKFTSRRKRVQSI